MHTLEKSAKLIALTSMLSDKIIRWYLANKRDLPWRNTNDPYLIWLSEIMLQQTRVSQGLNYFLRFRETFPRVTDLAEAEESKVLRLWQGLGYYSRARNLHKAAKIVSNAHSGLFPQEYEEIKKLPGIGNYTAAAIASIAFKKAHAAVDGNVYRVLSRLFSIETAIDTGKGKRDFEQLANSLMDRKQPGLFNQGLMEIGALVCKPQNPDCPICPLHIECTAFQKGTVLQYPRKLRKQKVRNRFFNYLFIESENKFYLQKRTRKGIWQNLFEFYLIEVDQALNSVEEVEKLLPDWLTVDEKLWRGQAKPYKHLLSHQKIHALFWHLKLPEMPADRVEHFYSATELERLPKHKLIVEYLCSQNLHAN